MPTQRNIAHVNDGSQRLKVIYETGNAAIASAVISLSGGQLNADEDGNPFQESIPFNLGLAQNLIGKTIEIFADLAQNPAVQSNTLILRYELSNVTWILPDKPHILTSDTPVHDTFNISIDLI